MYVADSVSNTALYHQRALKNKTKTSLDLSPRTVLPTTVETHSTSQTINKFLSFSTDKTEREVEVGVKCTARAPVIQARRRTLWLHKCEGFPLRGSRGSRGSSPPPANRKLSLAGRPRPIWFPRQTKIDWPLFQRRVEVSECGVEKGKGREEAG